MALAATRLIPMRKNKGKSIGACLHNHTSYIQNPDKTEQGELVSSYQCSPLTVDEEFLLTKRLYEQTTGRSQKSDVIAYQVRQSFQAGRSYAGGSQPHRLRVCRAVFEVVNTLLSLPPTPTGHTSTTTLFIIPLPWTGPGNSKISGSPPLQFSG